MAKRLVILSLLATMLAVVPAHASSSTCSFSGTGAGLQVARVDLPHGAGGRLILYLGGQRPIYGVVNKNNDYGAEGVVVMNAAGQIETYFVRGVSTWGAPEIVVSNGPGGTNVNRQIVGTDEPLGWHQSYLPPGLAEGTHYVIGFGVGGFNYDTRITLQTDQPYDCVPQNLDAEQIHFDVSDFKGDQTYVPYYGHASNARLTFGNEHQFFVGFLHASVDQLAPKQAGEYMRLEYQTPAPGPSGTTGDGWCVCATWPKGSSEFTLSYNGVLPFVEIAGWAFSISP